MYMEFSIQLNSFTLFIKSMFPEFPGEFWKWPKSRDPVKISSKVLQLEINVWWSSEFLSQKDSGTLPSIRKHTNRQTDIRTMLCSCSFNYVEGTSETIVMDKKFMRCGCWLCLFKITSLWWRLKAGGGSTSIAPFTGGAPFDIGATVQGENRNDQAHKKRSKHRPFLIIKPSVFSHMYLHFKTTW